eukprot:CAMPEP_0206164386 /NCGR_PEP_ID=MMETSP1474-20131121/16069_1 /ASSEMBLY_ACC=CAM_ASM_001110 /TAXON_ID=97495 /ORGANISM="Imantonia sp., Strain RCC918" /LENGTH=56 /DNA_ID=CAMNT_0053567235 /DNA_START=110 /DNA_END=276 /DNA_ORIENTATION=-
MLRSFLGMSPHLGDPNVERVEHVEGDNQSDDRRACRHQRAIYASGRAHFSRRGGEP